MNQEQIDKECDAIVIEHYKLIDESDFVVYPSSVTEMTRKQEILATQHAILHQTKIVEMLESIPPATFENYYIGNHLNRIDNANKILENLKSRVK